MQLVWITIVLLVCVVLGGGKVMGEQKTIRYVAIGDSYTIGTGARPEESWPAVITERLKNKGVAISLEGNLGRSGWTTQDVINYQLSEAERLRPDVVTILIGTNDWVQGMDASTFQTNIRAIYKRVIQIVPDRKRILVVTTPDFSIMPKGYLFSGGRDSVKGVSEFNTIIVREAEAQQLQVVDLFPYSRTMGDDAALASDDGVHPSAKGYAKWADVIEPAFNNLNL
jgi:acyl-CoA thioesterase-1